MDRTAWNERYASQPLLWGAEPNRFVAAELRDLQPRGRALDLACGEGRNAIWLAKLGWTVTGVDYSEVALERARRLAADQQVAVEWIGADVVSFAPSPRSFDLVVIAYLQVPGPDRRAVLARAAAALRPGGMLFLIGHARINLTQGIGGPQQPEVLWEPADLRQEVAALGLAVQRAEHVRRPVETTDGVKDAIDTLLVARREIPASRA
jgi:2-polyprenyl-3-methyl-5-hydroxy-6-metoxy-1,4-benzoquinol methylase